jgi:hypothetical protein
MAAITASYVSLQLLKCLSMLTCRIPEYKHPSKKIDTGFFSKFYICRILKINLAINEWTWFDKLKIQFIELGTIKIAFWNCASHQ